MLAVLGGCAGGTRGTGTRISLFNPGDNQPDPIGMPDLSGLFGTNSCSIVAGQLKIKSRAQSELGFAKVIHTNLPKCAFAIPLQAERGVITIKQIGETKSSVAQLVERSCIKKEQEHLVSSTTLVKDTTDLNLPAYPFTKGRWYQIKIFDQNGNAIQIAVVPEGEEKCE